MHAHGLAETSREADPAPTMAARARVRLLAVIYATSLPAIAPLYLSPASSVGLLFTIGVLADATLRLTGRQA